MAAAHQKVIVANDFLVCSKTRDEIVASSVPFMGPEDAPWNLKHFSDIGLMKILSSGMIPLYRHNSLDPTMPAIVFIAVDALGLFVLPLRLYEADHCNQSISAENMDLSEDTALHVFQMWVKLAVNAGYIAIVDKLSSSAPPIESQMTPHMALTIAWYAAWGLKSKLNSELMVLPRTDGFNINAKIRIAIPSLDGLTIIRITTALSEVCRCASRPGRLDTLLLLINAGADVASMDLVATLDIETLYPALYHAGATPCGEMLLAARAPVDYPSCVINGNQQASLLERAIETRSTVLTAMYTAVGADVTNRVSCDERGFYVPPSPTTMHSILEKAVRLGNKDALMFLIVAGAPDREVTTAELESIQTQVPAVKEASIVLRTIQSCSALASLPESIQRDLLKHRAAMKRAYRDIKDAREAVGTEDIDIKTRVHQHDTMEYAMFPCFRQNVQVKMH